ncbi:4Fe-4S dicluster domain-containing protein [bacterium]|nr:4Fe-4S dicluster domain-containing protein [bacterium]
MNRREFLKAVGLTATGALLSACDQRGPTKLISRILPTDSNLLPGEALLVRSTCTECPAGCGLIASVRNGHPVKLEGNPEHPLNRGALCLRGQASLSRLYLPQRLRQPLVRAAGGGLEPATWEQALARIRAALGEDGGRRHLFLSGRTAGALAEVIDLFCAGRRIERLPDYEVFSQAALRQANELVFGRPEIPEFAIGRADLLVSLGADLVETFINPVGFAMDLASARERDDFRWIHFEPHFSLTGNHAGERRTLRPASEPWLLAWLLSVLPPRRPLPAAVAAALPKINAADAARETGLGIGQLHDLAQAFRHAQAPLLVVGGVATAHPQGLLTAVLAALLQASQDMAGRTVDFSLARNDRQVGAPNDLGRLEDRLRADRVGVLFLHQVNPVAYRPSLAAAITQAKFRVGFSDVLNPTMETCDVVLPLSHSLESWGEEEPCRGLRSVIQPALTPLGQTRSLGDILLSLNGQDGSYAEHLDRRWGAEQDELRARGFQRIDTINPALTLQSRAATDFLERSVLLPVPAGRTLVVVPSLRTYDGRSDVLPLLSEVPDTLAAISYGEWLMISGADAQALGVRDRDVVEAVFTGGQVRLPVRIQPALPAGVVVVQQPFLQGAAHPCDPQTGEFLAVLPIEALQPVQDQGILPILSGSMDAAGRGIQGPVEHEHKHEHERESVAPTLYPKHEHQDYRWAMAVDLDRCTGCGACVAACYVENNIPLVGPDEHVAGREMSWIRLEPYLNDQGKLDIVPMLCQHCDHAPCEAVCPVYATYHTPEGLNAQVYNRCVGTRYCANNCPYKVRRFNWLDHPREKPLELMLNPDVSARPKGVMEKCTFCIQRITRAKDRAQDDDRLVRDGEVVPACAQTCPAQAIVFGNLLDPRARVHGQSQSPRAYRVLEELGTQPAVSYLKTGGEPHEA